MWIAWIYFNAERALGLLVSTKNQVKFEMNQNKFQKCNLYDIPI